VRRSLPLVPMPPGPLRNVWVVEGGVSGPLAGRQGMPGIGAVRAAAPGAALTGGGGAHASVPSGRVLCGAIVS
jgi:hypothetical protein